MKVGKKNHHSSLQEWNKHAIKKNGKPPRRPLMSRVSNCATRTEQRRDHCDGQRRRRENKQRSDRSSPSAEACSLLGGLSVL